MRKSFYYSVTWKESTSQRITLKTLGIPYNVEIMNGTAALVFPDLPVREYAKVRQLFGRDGLAYPQ